MNNFSTFEMKTAIHFGDNALDRLKEIPYKRVLIITDPFVVQSGMVNLITAPLSSAGIEYDIFCDVVPDAPLNKIAEGVKKFLQYQPEAVVAVGGGSAIDSSKAIREFALKINNYGKVGLIAVPTTSGTGSEVTSFAVVNDTEAHVKYPLIADSLTADEAILDAELVKSVPPAITADTGMDVITHAIEAYVSNTATDFSDALAEKALTLAYNNILRAYNNGNDIEAREGLHNASCLAGMAFNSSGLGITHSLAHAIGGKLHIPHGKANAIMLPYVMEFNSGLDNKLYMQECSEVAKKYSRLAKLLDMNANSTVIGVNNLIKNIFELQKKLNIPQTLMELGVDINIVLGAKEEILNAALKDICTKANPVDVSREDLEKLLDRIIGNK